MLEESLSRADGALFAAAEGGRKCVVCAGCSMEVGEDAQYVLHHHLEPREGSEERPGVQRRPARHGTPMPSPAYGMTIPQPRISTRPSARNFYVSRNRLVSPSARGCIATAALPGRAAARVSGSALTPGRFCGSEQVIVTAGSWSAGGEPQLRGVDQRQVLSLITSALQAHRK